MHDDSSPLQRRAWPARRQWRAVSVVALLTALPVLIWAVIGRNAATAAHAAESVRSPNQVRLSREQLATVGTSVVQTDTFHDTVIADGELAVNADAATAIYTPFSGRVVKVNAAVGDRVRRGAVLLSLDASEALDARNSLVTAAAQERLAVVTETRRHAAYDSKGGSLQDWQQAQAELAAARATLSAARGRLRVLGSSDDQILDLERSGAVSAATTIASPIDGVVTARQVGPGQVLQAGDSTALYTVADLSTVWLNCAVRDSDAVNIVPGQAIVLQVAALPGRDFHVKVQTVGAEVDPQTRRVTVRAVVANTDGRLKPAMLATVSIITSSDSVAVAVPAAAIVQDGESTHVWVVHADGVLEARPIRIGRANGLLREVRSGLSPGERVVTSGSLFVDSAAHPD